MQAIYNRAMGLRESNLHGELTVFPDISLVGCLGTLPSYKETNSISQLWPHNIYSQGALYGFQSQIIRELILLIEQYRLSDQLK